MGKFRIMVVDDDPDVRFIVTSLMSLEFETTQASNGLDALEKIERYEPDLLLMDVNMPVMNGIACCAAIQRDPAFERVPVIFVSASSDPKVRADAMAAGALAFFEKPFETTALIDAIHEHFRAAGAKPSEKLFSVAELTEIDSLPMGSTGAAHWNFDQTFGRSTTRRDDGRQVDTDTVSDVHEDSGGKKRRTFGRSRKVQPPAEPLPETSTVQPAPPEAPAISVPVEVALPEPPAPDYKRVSQEYSRKLSFGKKQEPPAAPPEVPRPSTPAGRPSGESVTKPVFKSSEPPAAPPLPPAPPQVAVPSGPAASPPRPAEPLVAPPPPAAAPVRPPQKVPSEVPVPAPAAVSAPPPAPPLGPQPAKAPADKGPSPQEILAQRRRAVLAKAGINTAGGRTAGPDSSSSKPRILVIIDTPGQLQICTDALRGMAEFLPLEDPVEAIVLIARFQPDIVMCGILERKYSGLQLGNMIRSNPRLAHIELIFVQSAYAEPSHVNAAMALSRNSILRPPLGADRLRHVVEEILRKPAFQVREKSLPYGVYVKEVIRAAEAERLKENKHREKQSFENQFQTLAAFMAKELKDYREPQGFDELKGPGHKAHQIGDA
jgi:CheY-like chemotaxis protein